MYLPVFWLNESAVVDEKHETMLQRKLFAPMEITSVIEKVLMIVGGCLVLLVVFVMCRQSRKSDSMTLAPGPVPAVGSNGFARRGRNNRQTGRGAERQPLLLHAAQGQTSQAAAGSDDHGLITKLDSTDPTYHSPVEA